MYYREITPADMPAIFAVRVATDENNLSLEQLTELGITAASVVEMIADTHKGWLCEADGRVIGFAMGNRRTGELWVIAVLPAYVNRDIGSILLRLVEGWLWEQGCVELWLTTGEDIRLRAYSFYRKHGWEDDGLRGGARYMKKAIRDAR